MPPWKSKAVVAALVASTGFAQASAAPADPLERQHTLYTLGYLMGARMAGLQMTQEELPSFLEGLSSNEYLPPTEEGRQRLFDKLSQLRKDRVLERERHAGREFVAAAAQEKGAVVTPSGSVFKELKAGKGKRPLEGAVVDLRYVGKLRDGTIFDTSDEGGRVTSRLDLWTQTPCIRDAVVKMKEGGKARITCLDEQAYQDVGWDRRRVPPGAAVTFELELVKIQ